MNCTATYSREGVDSLFTYYAIFCAAVIGIVLENTAKSKKAKAAVAVPLLVLLAFVSGTRYELGGTDYSIYRTTFESVPKLGSFDPTTVRDLPGTYSLELGYLFINSLVKSAGFSFYGFTLLHSIFFYVALYFGLRRYSANFSLLIVVFLYKLFFYNTFVSLRQSITIALFFLALRYMQNRNIVRYMFIAALATLIHNAAFILVPVYFLTYLNVSRNLLLVLNAIFLPTLVLRLFGVDVASAFSPVLLSLGGLLESEKFEGFAESDPTAALSPMHTVEYLALMLLVLIFCDRIVREYAHGEFTIKLFVAMLPLFTLFSGYAILTRLKDYFVLSYGLILGYVAYMDARKRAPLIEIAVIGVSLLGYLRFIYLFDDGAMNPYESFAFVEGVSIFE